MLTATPTPATTRPLHGSMTSASSSPSSASHHHHHHHQQQQQSSRARMPSSTQSQTKSNTYTHPPRPSDDSSSQSSSSSSSSEDDDVPLAAAIPGALKAQRTIRRQYREERAARKARAPNNNNPPPPQLSSPPSTSVPSSPPLASALPASGPPTTMSAVAANLMRSKTVLKPGEAPRLRPHIADQLKQRAAQAQAQAQVAAAVSSPPMPSAQISPTRATHDISRRLQNTQLADPGSISSGPRQRSRSHTLNGSAQRPVIPPESHPQTLWAEAPAVPSLDPAQLQPPRTVRPVRSFHNTPPTGGAAGLGRSATTSRRRPDAANEQVQQQPISSGGASGLGRSGTTSRRRPDPADDQNHPQHPPPQAGATLERAKSSRTPRTASNPTSRVSNEIDRSRTLLANSGADASLPVPPIPSIPSSVKLVQQKIYIGDNALPHTVELAPGATAGAVLGMLDEQGALSTWVGSGGWMLFESARDFGLERPIRTFERLEDVLASWNRDRTDNIIVARLSAMAGVLARSQVPAENVGYGGWVEYEAKRGKWSKRWLSLREGALWVGKKEGGRNGEMLVQLSNFDAYNLTKVHKAPKSGTFAIKSTESLAFFEDVGDFMHVFSLEERGAEVWMQKILLARSFVILQERNQKAAAVQGPSSAATASPNPGSSTISAPVGGAKGLSRAGTTRRPVPAQPLVVVPPPYQQPNAVQGPPADYGFEPGTLLGRR